MNARRWCVAAVALLLWGVALPAQADLHISGGVGGLVPWRGEVGHSSIGQVLGSIFSERLRIGGEVEYSSYQTDTVGLDDVGVTSYNGRAIVQFVPFPTTLSPYLGLGAGLNVVELDDDRLDRVHSSVDKKAIGVGIGGIGFAGVHVPLGTRLSLFGEARAGVSFNANDELDQALGSDRLGGFSGMAGMRVSF